MGFMKEMEKENSRSADAKCAKTLIRQDKIDRTHPPFPFQ
jgi:hypothetical protein